MTKKQILAPTGDARYWDAIAKLRYFFDKIMQFEKLRENLNTSKSQLVLNQHLLLQNRIEIAVCSLLEISYLFCKIIQLTVCLSKIDNLTLFMWRSWQQIYCHSCYRWLSMHGIWNYCILGYPLTCPTWCLRNLPILQPMSSILLLHSQEGLIACSLGSVSILSADRYP